MPLSSFNSFIVSSIISVFVLSIMMIFSSWLVTSKITILFGGYIGSWLFFFILCAIGNMESALFGKAHQIKLFPEVIVSLLISVFVSATVHRICATVCFLFSLVALRYFHQISQKEHSRPAPPVAVKEGQSRKKNK